MRNILNLLNILFTSLFFVIRESVCESKAVSRPEWLGNLYLSLRGDEKLGHPPNLEEIARTQICNDIVSSKFWEHRVELVLPEKMWATLNQKKNKHIFHQLYRKKETTSSQFITLGLKRKSDYYFSNPYITRKILFAKLDVDRIEDDSSEEHVFICVVKYKDTREVVAWYVSREYVSKESVPVRFILYFSQEIITTGEIILSLKLLAEEPAKVLEDPHLDIERYYLNLKKDHQQASNKEHDPLCQQTLQYGQLSRFCTSILSSTYLDDKIDHLIFVAQTLQSQCMERKIDFQNEDVKKEAGEQSFKEWMILCKAKTSDTNSFKYFYISRAYASGQAFLFNSDIFYGHVKLVNRFTNISLHDDGLTPDSSRSMNAQLENMTPNTSESPDVQIENVTPNMSQSTVAQIENVTPNMSQRTDAQIEDVTLNLRQSTDAQIENMTSNMSQSTVAQTENTENMAPNMNQSTDARTENVTPDMRQSSDTQTENVTPNMRQSSDAQIENMTPSMSQPEDVQIKHT